MTQEEDIRRAVETMRNGGVILYPTDTVWGIGCDATNPEAVAKVYAIKQRSDSGQRRAPAALRAQRT